MVTLDPAETYYTGSLSPKWTGYFFTDAKEMEPITDVRWALSRPCGNLNGEYMLRYNSINPIYSNYESFCKFSWDDGSKYHTLYHETNFKSDELSVYTDNKLIQDIQDAVPAYNSNELKKNSFVLMYKTYSKWSAKCQEKYSTLDVVEKTESISKAT
jgi:hypothetical protein